MAHAAAALVHFTGLGDFRDRIVRVYFYADLVALMQVGLFEHFRISDFQSPRLPFFGLDADGLLVGVYLLDRGSGLGGRRIGG